MSYDRTPTNPHDLNSLLSPHSVRSGDGANASDDRGGPPEREGSYNRSSTAYAAGDPRYTHNPPYQSPPAQSAAYHRSAAHRNAEYEPYDNGSFDYASRDARRYEGGAPVTEPHHYSYSSSRYARDVDQPTYAGSGQMEMPIRGEFADYRDEYTRQTHTEYDYAGNSVAHHQVQPHRQAAYDYGYEYERSQHARETRGVYDRDEYARHASSRTQQQQQQQQPYHYQQDEYYSRRYDYGSSAPMYAQEPAVGSVDYGRTQISGGAQDPPHASSSAMYYDDQHQGRHKYASRTSAAYGYDTRGEPQPYAYNGAEAQAGYSTYGHASQQPGAEATKTDNATYSSSSSRYRRYQDPSPTSGYPTNADADYRSPNQEHHAHVFQRGQQTEYGAGALYRDNTDPYSKHRASAYDDRNDERVHRPAGIGITSLLAETPDPRMPAQSRREDGVSAAEYQDQHRGFGHRHEYGGEMERYDRRSYHYAGYADNDPVGEYGKYHPGYPVNDNDHVGPHGVMSISQLVGSGGNAVIDASNGVSGQRHMSADIRSRGDDYGYGGSAVDNVSHYERGSVSNAELGHAGLHSAHDTGDGTPNIATRPASSRNKGLRSGRQSPRQTVPTTLAAEDESKAFDASRPTGADARDSDSGDNMPLAERADRQLDSINSSTTSPVTANADESATKPPAKRRRQAQNRNDSNARRGNKTAAAETNTKRRAARKGRGNKKIELSREYVYDEDDEDDEDEQPALEQSAARLSGDRFSADLQDEHDVAVPNAGSRPRPAEEYSVDEHVQAYIHHVKQRTDRAVAKYEERAKRKSERIHEHVVQRYAPYLRGYFERNGMSGPENGEYDDRLRHEDDYEPLDDNGHYYSSFGRDYHNRFDDQAYSNGYSYENGNANSNGNGNGNDYGLDMDGYYDSLHYQSHVPPMGYFSPNRPSSPNGFEEGYVRGRSTASGASEAVMQNAEEEVHRPGKSGRKSTTRNTLLSRLAVEHIPQAYRSMQSSIQIRNSNLRKLASVGQREARRLYAPASTRLIQINQLRPIMVARPPKDLQMRARRSMREMLLFWKRHEKEEREMRKRAEKEAAEKLKLEEEAREARRQARKLNFLITQTELYSHFIGSKIGGEDAQKTASSSDNADGGQVKDPLQLDSIDFDADDDAALAAHARQSAQNALAQQQAQTREFDDIHRKQQGGEQSKDANVADALDAMDFQDPETMAGTTDITQPRMLMCQLKEYQLKGLNWLANLYEQGINGILADEMGLGKTVQSISLLAYLAETHNIWGPFMVVAPASTLHNWQQELSRFVPEFKILPYWGSQKDRKVLRKSLWNPKNLSRKDSAFHVLVTSYQLVVSDESYLNRVKWQYMVLDEAQAIKSSTSARWKTLLGFHCRNRLLLTGTPIQNSMQELWALLHFIMPTLFDSHEEFSEWFSRDIEAHAENRAILNQHQLHRLHVILKPFMLRRHKRHVQHELGEKIEHLVACDLTQRQKVMYRGLMSKISVPELLERLQSGSGHGGKDESDESLMNLVMQFRKVCSHPELFERAEVESPFVSGVFPTTGSLSREGDDISCTFATRSLTPFRMPKLLYRESLEVPNLATSRQGLLRRRFMLWSPQTIAQDDSSDGLFGLLRLCAPSASYAVRAFTGTLSQRLDDIAEHSCQAAGRKQYEFMCQQSGEPIHQSQGQKQAPALASCKPGSVLHALSNVFAPENLRLSDELASLAQITTNGFEHSPMSLVSPAYMPPAVSPPIELVISDRSATWENEDMLLHNPVAKRLTCGRNQSSEDADWSQPFRSQGLTDIWMPSMDKLIRYSGKMAVLDRLLIKLKQEGHRVLLYFQMTKMIDLFEEYLAYRKYTYLRLDGSSKISDRRDMVMDWQTRDDIFIFLLSTRAGGLGINLTAADTVIFFESDWNPTVDSQAMDRAHRLGQTKQVVVYRLITRGTVEERILQRARQKDEIHRIVIAGGDANAAKEASSIVTDGDQATPSISEGFSSSFEPSSKELVSLLLGETADDDSAVRKKRLVMARHAQETSNRIYGAGGKYPGKPDIALLGLDWDSVVLLPPPNIGTAEAVSRVVSGPLDTVIDGAIEQQVREKQARERELRLQQLQQRQRGRGGRGGGRGAASTRGAKRGGGAAREKRKARAVDGANKDSDAADTTAGGSKTQSRVGTPEPNSSKRPRTSASARDLVATATEAAAAQLQLAVPSESKESGAVTLKPEPEPEPEVAAAAAASTATQN
ncbi:putative DNA helicase ino80 [Coemansia sp. RSA 1721]|nr:putative DNA helicase ino80 [Coemansia sp. RSA 1721]